MNQNQCSLAIKNMTIKHCPDGRIIQTTVKGRPLEDFVLPLLGQITIQFDLLGCLAVMLIIEKDLTNTPTNQLPEEQDDS